jgi:aryl sulfotransferase
VPPFVDYRSWDDDNGRWEGFPFREGDIVISTRSKSGTTWLQMVCALLVFQTPDLPAPLAELSPWLDWRVVPRDEVVATLAAQGHRRFIKTHTPLDGLPLDPRASFVVGARHPLDVAVSLYHHGDNLDRARIAALTGEPPPRSAGPRPPLDEWLRAWVDWEGRPRERLDSLPGVLHHLTDAWARRQERNVVLVHYEDLEADLADAMRRLADRLGFEVPAARWPALVEAAGFEAMRSRADELAPDRRGALRDRHRFFRRGTSGAGREVLGEAGVRAYEDRARALAPPDLLAWLHR